MDRIQRILWIELLGGIGDMVIALPAIHALGRSQPQADLTVLTFAPGGELLHTDPLIHQVICAQPGQARQAVEQLLSDETFDLIVSDCSYDGIAELVSSSGAQRVVTNLWRSPPSNQRVGDRFIEMLLTEGLVSADQCATTPIHLTAAERNSARQFLAAAHRPVVVLCPDAGMAIKRWSVERFIAVGKTLQQSGATILVITGAELDRSAQIAAAIADSILLPAVPLRQLAAFLAAADLVIGADTGPVRIAAALNVPTITLFGPSWQGRYGQPAPHVNLQGFPTCPERNIANFTEQSCWYSGTCPFEWQTCLDDISTEMVVAAAMPMLNFTAVLSRVNHSLVSRGVGCGVWDGVHANEDGRQVASTSSAETVLPQPSTDSSSSLLPQWRSLSNLLVMRLDNIGDVIMTSPAIRAIKENLPNTKLTFMASPSGALAAELLPGVDQVLPWRVLWQDLGQLDFDPEREWQLVERLKRGGFDGVIIFTSFAQSPHPAAWLCQLAGMPLRLGESKQVDLALSHAALSLPDSTHQVDRNLSLIETVGFRVRDRRLCLNGAPLPFALPQPYIVLNPWTTCQSRNYDPQRFAVAARILAEKTGHAVVVTGMAKDRDRSQLILDILGKWAIDVIGKTTLAELVTLIARARLLLTNNTSTMHIADATQTPNLVMFAGTEHEHQWQPRYSPSRLLRRPTVCSPCYAFTCPYDLECLDIAIEVVVTAGLELLETLPSDR